jgi:hypothetical protein
LFLGQTIDGAYIRWGTFDDGACAAHRRLGRTAAVAYKVIDIAVEKAGTQVVANSRGANG